MIGNKAHVPSDVAESGLVAIHEVVRQDLHGSPISKDGKTRLVGTICLNNNVLDQRDSPEDYRAWEASQEGCQTESRYRRRLGLLSVA